jgi:hypothetical protein
VCTDGFWDGGLASRSGCVAAFPLGSLLLCSVPVLDLLQRFAQQQQMPAFAINVPVHCCRTAQAAVCPPEQHRQSRLAVRDRRLPLWTDYPLWTDDGFGLPVDVEVFLGEAGPFNSTWGPDGPARRSLSHEPSTPGVPSRA